MRRRASAAERAAHAAAEQAALDRAERRRTAREWLLASDLSADTSRLGMQLCIAHRACQQQTAELSRRMRIAAAEMSASADRLDAVLSMWMRPASLLFSSEEIRSGLDTLRGAIRLRDVLVDLVLDRDLRDV